MKLSMKQMNKKKAEVLNGEKSTHLLVKHFTMPFIFKTAMLVNTFTYRDKTTINTFII